MKLRVAIIGCGAQGRNHLECYRRMPDVEIAAICERNPVRLKASMKDFEISHGFPDYGSLLDAGSYDLVSVCVMPVDHRDVTLAALANGAHVMCEKPFAMNATEAAEMITAARQAKRILTIGTNMRFLGNTSQIHQAIEKGLLGDHVYTRAWTNGIDIPWWGPHNTKAISGGGALASTAVHILDCALFLADFPPPISVSGMTARLYPEKRGNTLPKEAKADPYDVDDFVAAFVRFANGTVLSLESTHTYDGPDSNYSLEFVGTKGTARLDPLEIYCDQDGQSVNVTPPHLPGVSWLDSIDALLQDVVAAIRENREPTILPEQSLTVQRISDAIYESAATSREVRLD